MTSPQATGQQAGIMETVKEKMNMGQLVDKISESRNLIFDVVLYGSIGLLTGYLLKRYSGAVIVIILMTSALMIMQQFELIVLAVNWDKINEILGLAQANKLLADNMVPLAIEWAKANMLVVVSMLIGFLVGIKVG
jgi:hypothetical protein